MTDSKSYDEAGAALRGHGPFSFERDFARFLSRLGKVSANPGNNHVAFVARNFLLDEGITADRVTSYRSSGAAVDHAALEEWRGTHKAYLSDKVFLREGSGLGPDRLVDASDPFTCPETFRSIDPASPFLATDERMHLIKVIEVDFIARRTRRPHEEITSLARAVAEGSADTATQGQLDDLLQLWVERCELRPVFAAIWEDVERLFKDDDPSWPDRLRDQLGLAHLDPGMSGKPAEINVIVMRYPVRDVPRLRGADQVALLPPTVLDGEHSCAFCPAPRGKPYGHTVNLGHGRPLPRREVLHPAMRFRPEHVWRVGTIRHPVDVENLPTARALHLLDLRRTCDRPDYAAGTDGELLR